KTMSLSMYDASAPLFLQGLKGLAIVLGKGEAFARETGLDPAELIGARLAPDMFPLSAQVQIATDQAKGALGRLAGREVPRWEDNETSFAELQARLAKAVAYAESFRREEFEGAENRRVELRTRVRTLEFIGLDYLLHFALPNFFFHVTTAYDILRWKGVGLGKRDFLAR
ncbi:MAG TPA: DUF1993 domain-containing protein, partial [Paracoccaceae bacterium]|nr:DUF1993 domain-containing protein [Paracoccaceae bacterium]